ncbi:MAG: acetyl-CoA acetyltransferase [Deltaproteobacteria bacterium]|nr:acetyl-CoA acetyltransferase [Deltaproteobacteria bacterium]
MDDRTPILIGAGQITQRDVAPQDVLEPVALMRDAARAAADDARLTVDALRRIDTVAVVNLLSWNYANAPRLLAGMLGAAPRDEIYTMIGGNSPQSLVDDTARRIARGEVGLALLAGGEVMNGVKRARRAGVRLAWGDTGEVPEPRSFGDARQGTNDLEVRHGLFLPVQVYPLFENAIRARAGRTPGEHLRFLGELYARFSSVAAANPFAWFRTPRTAEQIATVDADNRIIAWPYPKRMNAIMDVDQAAAVLMTSVGRARELGVPRGRWVFLQGFGEAHDKWFVSERCGYAQSPAIAAAGRRALEMAGIGIADVDLFDLYSCFPSAVQLAQEALGIAPADPRPLTVTGGLAAFGGPGNNYSMHGIASMMDRLRAAPGTRGLVTALGWYVTKHAIGVYGTEPGPAPWRAPEESLQPAIDAMPSPEVVDRAEGAATIETYTVAHERGGEPERGIVIGRLDDDRRFLAVIDGDRAELESLERDEGVGRRGRVLPGADGVSRFRLA